MTRLANEMNRFGFPAFATQVLCCLKMKNISPPSANIPYNITKNPRRVSVNQLSEQRITMCRPSEFNNKAVRLEDQDEDAALDDLLAAVEDRVASLETGVQETAHSVASLEACVTSLQAETQSLEVRVASLEAETQSLEVCVTSLQAETQSLEVRVTSLETGMQETAHSVSSLEVHVTSLHAETQAIANKLTSLEAKMQKTAEDSSSLEARIRRLEIRSSRSFFFFGRWKNLFSGRRTRNKSVSTTNMA